jgi:G:T/U-mismatch repair DNA glycosylase
VVRSRTTRPPPGASSDPRRGREAGRPGGLGSARARPQSRLLRVQPVSHLGAQRPPLRPPRQPLLARPLRRRHHRPAVQAGRGRAAARARHRLHQPLPPAHARADELTREEIRAGAEELREKLERLQPRAVAYTGIGVYKWFRATSKVGWGVQEVPAVPGVTDVVVPSPSGLNRMLFDVLVEHYRPLATFLR